MNSSFCSSAGSRTFLLLPSSILWVYLKVNLVHPCRLSSPSGHTQLPGMSCCLPRPPFHGQFSAHLHQTCCSGNIQVRFSPYTLSLEQAPKSSETRVMYRPDPAPLSSHLSICFSLPLNPLLAMSPSHTQLLGDLCFSLSSIFLQKASHEGNTVPGNTF